MFKKTTKVKKKMVPYSLSHVIYVCGSPQDPELIDRGNCSEGLHANSFSFAATINIYSLKKGVNNVFLLL